MSDRSGHGDASPPDWRRRNSTRARSWVGRRGPGEDRQSCRPHTIDERVDGVVAGIRDTDLLAERQSVQSSLDSQHEVVAIAVPDQPALLDDIIEHGGDVGALDCCGEADAGAGPPPVEISRDDELGPRQRIVVGQPRCRSGAHLELARSPSCRQSIRKPGQQQPSAEVRRRSTPIETDPGATGEIVGACRQASHARRGRRARR